MSRIKVGIVGVGNCASGIIQGVDLYRKNDKNARDARALGNAKIGGYRIDDIEFVSAFDVGANKVGKPLCDAIVRESPVLDGVGLYVDDKIELSPGGQRNSSLGGL